MVISRWLRVPLLAVLGALSLAMGASRAVFLVTKTPDDNGACDIFDCALREAILAANALPGPDTIQVPAGVYQLSRTGAGESGGDLDVLDDVEILGVPGETFVVGDQERVLVIRGVLNVKETRADFYGLNITGGVSDLGGGISASVADVELTECVISGNQATLDGGGILFGIGTMSLVRSAVTGNQANRFGGGIRRVSSLTPTTLVIRNSTVSENSADVDGGAIYSTGAGGEIRIEQSTIVENYAGSFGSLIFQRNSIGPQFLNSILEGDCFFIASQFPMSLGGNVGGPNNPFCFLDQPSDQPDVLDLGLLPLGDYGGPTPTHALMPGSPAVDTALLSDCPVQDQRGRPRPIDGNLDGMADCDAGAVELQALTTPVAVTDLGIRSLMMTALLIALVASRRILLLRWELSRRAILMVSNP